MSKKIIDFICPYCGNNKSYVNQTIQSEAGECTSCGEMTYYNKRINISTTPIVKCPHCHSTNTKKISTTSKVGSVALFGIFAVGKVSKQWHCNNCKSDF